MPKSTQESKGLIGSVVSQRSLWNDIFLIPSSLHQQHNSIKTFNESFKLSTKSTAVRIIKIIQTIEMIFLLQMDSARWSGTHRVKHEQQKWDSSC